LCHGTFTTAIANFYTLKISNLYDQKRSPSRFFEDYPFVATLFGTGARPSEIIALRWGDIDLKLGTLSISKSITWAKMVQPRRRQASG
jgi:integrase